MQRLTVSLLFLVASQLGLAVQLYAAPAAAPCPAQATTAASPAQNTPKSPPAPGTTPNAASAPVSAADASGAQDPAPDPDAVGKKPKKVWTNENVKDGTGPISVVGDAHNSKTKSSPQTPPDAAYISSVRKQLQKLQEQMAAADKELLSLKNFSEGEPVATANREFHKSYNNEPIAHQITNLQAKKADLQSKIDTLLDEARKKGVEPGQLR